MKKALCILLGAALLASCSHLRESDAVDASIQGVLAGEGRFLDKDLSGEYGTFPVAIEVHADNSVTGTVGAATLTDGVIKSRPEDFLVDGKLTGPVFAEGSLPGEKKDCVGLILQPQDDGSMGGNIHLRTNPTFDFTMRVGGLDLARAP